MPQILHSNRSWSYDYRILQGTFSDSQINNYINKKRKHFDLIVNSWTPETNSEWIHRNYLAGKMLMASTILLTSFEYGKRKNIKITEPYSIYYALFNCCRGLLFTQPLALWKDGNLFEISHNGLSRQIENALSEIDNKFTSTFLNRFKEARDIREAFSYKFPSNGLSNFTNFSYYNEYSVIDDCSILAEISQLNSEILVAALEEGSPVINDEECELNDKFIEFDFGDDVGFEEEDYYRLGKHIRKYKKPYTIQTTMTEGLVDDFFGAWIPSDTDLDDDDYNPDYRNNIIFDFF